LKTGNIFSPAKPKSTANKFKPTSTISGPGAPLFDQLIATLRGITDIEQVERDRQQLQQEKSLENTIKAVGVGVATGTLTWWLLKMQSSLI
jgi:hypothetical protein